MNDEHQKFPYVSAVKVAQEIVSDLEPGCERIQIAGSIRREKPNVSDIEIVYIPRFHSELDTRDFFEVVYLPSAEDGRDPGYLPPRQVVNEADAIIARLEKTGVLARRKNSEGRETFGPKNKLMIHLGSGIPVDLFATTAECWWNYLVCRTGPAELNIAIARAAQRGGYIWHPYDRGFSKRDGSDMRRMESERDVFEFVGLPYREPAKR